MPVHHAGPKRVILLSDGTGNSSAKLMKTNVWRLYEAVDLTTGDQVAYYDNGVGTSSFAPLAILGGAIGWGLKRNVLSLYRFACQNYVCRDGGDTADAIYAFGFSRGAFTIRVLVNLIASQGLVTGVKGRELERRAKWAYRAYRQEFNPTGGLVTGLRRLRDWLLRTLERKPAYDCAANTRPRIAFVGLWDTVDAYGLPIDEMTRGWDQWVWPLSLGTHECPPIVEKACHAVALDDERHTFHPLLFDESKEPARTSIRDERITQVWFSGVHSNVGGGYPDDSLAHVSLRWMAEQASAAQRYLPLRLHPHMCHEWTARSDPNGPLFDSRRGLGAYYRYNPRRISRLVNDEFLGVRVPLPKIHATVFQRIAAGRDDYAPIVLPERYAVVTAAGDVVADAANAFEHPTRSAARCADQEHVWNDVWRRRVAYFATVTLTFLLVVPPFLLDANGGGLLTWQSRVLSGAIQTLGSLVPSAASPWVDYYYEYPFQLLVGSLLVAGLLGASTSLNRSIGDRMRGVWDVVLRDSGQPATPSALPGDWIYRLRTHPAYQRFFAITTQHLFPFVFGFGALLAAILVIVGSMNRFGFAAASATGFVCPEIAPVAWDGSPRTLELPSNELCLSTGLVLRQGRTYRVEVTSLSADWMDDTIPVTSPAGFASGRQPLVFVPSLPFRRVLTVPWFVPIARVGANSAEYHALGEGFAEFTPRHEGQLFLFVNDAIGPGPWFRSLYGNNHGVARVEVSRIAQGGTSTP